jgi:hypothetical protein
MKKGKKTTAFKHIFEEEISVQWRQSVLLAGLNVSTLETLFWTLVLGTGQWGRVACLRAAHNGRY